MPVAVSYTGKWQRLSINTGQLSLLPPSWWKDYIYSINMKIAQKYTTKKKTKKTKPKQFTRQALNKTANFTRNKLRKINITTWHNSSMYVVWLIPNVYCIYGIGLYQRMLSISSLRGPHSKVIFTIWNFGDVSQLMGDNLSFPSLPPYHSLPSFLLHLPLPLEVGPVKSS